MISFVLSYFNQTETLRNHIHVWRSYDNLLDKVEFIIVDDCSEYDAVSVLKTENTDTLNIQVYRIIDDIKFNIGGARNIGVSMTNNDWIIILDMDIIVTYESLKHMFQLIENDIQNVCYKFKRYIDIEKQTQDVQKRYSKKKNSVHPAVCLIRKNDYFQKVGGCDEDIVGKYGGTDEIFFHRIQMAKINIIVDSKVLLEVDASGECCPSMIKQKDYARNDINFIQKCKSKSMKTILNQSRLRFKYLHVWGVFPRDLNI